MTQLPKEEMKDKWKRWIKGHPILVAASIFLFLMAGSFVSIWTEGRDQFYVSVPNMEQIYVDYENSTVVVPDDQVIEGDLVVRNGNVEIRGEVTGDVIVTDGQVYQASTAHIAGQVEEIDQFMRWVWYHAQRWIKEALQLKP
ncbi:polymer-forming cytoskeletal protein [Caldalkalibacillus mannanilyticus]|uniref:polymer-forming cytoskeletal protein n=1 Tax=Caldalkalibacillus mannanilyticus TaxID=1418 RepID=UPI00068831DF|nr:polymer-forming cytoskeletal protein [Caldalkalibacillus mannanilyticus]